MKKIKKRSCNVVEHKELFFFPTTKGGMQNGSSAGIYTHRTQVCARLAPDLHAQSVLINEISASELRRKFFKNVLLVGLLFAKGQFGNFLPCHRSLNRVCSCFEEMMRKKTTQDLVHRAKLITARSKGDSLSIPLPHTQNFPIVKHLFSRRNRGFPI